MHRRIKKYFALCKAEFSIDCLPLSKRFDFVYPGDRDLEWVAIQHDQICQLPFSILPVSFRVPICRAAFTVKRSMACCNMIFSDSAKISPPPPGACLVTSVSMAIQGFTEGSTFQIV
jgi:hypothetical protein